MRKDKSNKTISSFQHSVFQYQTLSNDQNLQIKGGDIIINQDLDQV